MPVLSAFYGIIIRMYNEKGGKHNQPHIHVEYAGEEIVVALDGTNPRRQHTAGKNETA